jgi:hypothetical protein
MGKGGEETATRPRRGDFFYSEQVLLYFCRRSNSSHNSQCGDHNFLIFAFRQGACENTTSAQVNMLMQ